MIVDWPLWSWLLICGTLGFMVYIMGYIHGYRTIKPFLIMLKDNLAMQKAHMEEIQKIENQSDPTRLEEGES